MKLKKRIAAMGAAMVMAVSMIGVGASAVEINYNLHYAIMLLTDWFFGKIS